MDPVLYQIGCGEVKKGHNINLKLLESDRARIAETMERQLHARVMTIELYIMSFEYTAEVPYQLYKVLLRSRHTHTWNKAWNI
ncbi:unnamed protein product [Rhizopus stolonifer]